MSGRSPPLFCTLILITMHSHRSYPNITTVMHSYSIVLLSIIVPSSHTGIGAWVNSKMYTIILYNFLNCHAKVFKGCKYKTTSWHLTGPLFPIGIEHLIYMIFFCYGSSNGIGSSAPDWPGTVQKHSDTSTTLKKYVDRLIGTRKA